MLFLGQFHLHSTGCGIQTGKYLFELGYMSQCQVCLVSPSTCMDDINRISWCGEGMVSWRLWWQPGGLEPAALSPLLCDCLSPQAAGRTDPRVTERRAWGGWDLTGVNLTHQMQGTRSPGHSLRLPGPTGTEPKHGHHITWTARSPAPSGHNQANKSHLGASLWPLKSHRCYQILTYLAQNYQQI